MKIAFILSHGVLTPTNGVVSQARTWKNGLKELGYEVVLIDMWLENDWMSFDIIHFFGFSKYMSEFIGGLSKINPNIVVSPILDPAYSIGRLKLYSHWGNAKLNLSNQYYSLRQVKDIVKLFLVRSKFEQEYIVKGLNVPESKCKIVPLSFNITNLKVNLEKKESFCLHISLLTDKRKNVKRLIEAAKKYDFKLILGGKLRNKEEVELLHSWIGDSKKIEYKGYLSHEEIMDLYSRAKVFALPSINEGVGIVALEAAAMGCDIVMTNLGGPKEYYKDMAKMVDPYNKDEIGNAIKNFMGGDTFQPQLSHYIKSNFSQNHISNQLIEEYKELF